jgi:hypothetical protein
MSKLHPMLNVPLPKEISPEHISFLFWHERLRTSALDLIPYGKGENVELINPHISFEEGGLSIEHLSSKRYIDEIDLSPKQIAKTCLDAYMALRNKFEEVKKNETLHQ